ncbi:MAG TPA: hypothetical protein VFB83_10195, partial [Propionibacteriaceae bacterium]|nr:hypothetical protein [Propionibacteriaceae bacterium]
ILTVGRDMPPGEAFSYSSRGSHLVSAVLREALIRADGDHPRTVLEDAREKLFDPLEINSAARGALGQVIAIAPEHQTVVAIGSVPTTDLATGADEVWPLVNEVIVPSLG